jgi:hypothetical protein
MLSNLLPGLRELRAPFAAGALWVLASWMAWEPYIPSEVVATGVASSVYRLRGFLPAVASGAVAGFLAYLVGSLSVAVFSDAIKSRFSAVARGRQRFNALVPAAVEALYRVAADTRQDIEASLVVSGQAVEDFLNDQRQKRDNADEQGMRSFVREAWTEITEDFPLRLHRREIAFEEAAGPGFMQRAREAATERARALWPFKQLRRVRARRRRPITPHSAAPPPEAPVEEHLVALALSELNLVTTARLLGKDPDLYSAIDRHRAEVEFRVAVMPPLLVLFAAIAARVDNTAASALIVLGGIVIVAGLCWDALKQQRQAHGLLIDAASAGRVQFPSLERLRRIAAGVSEMSPLLAAQGVESEMTRAVAIIQKLDSFAPSATAALEATDRAARRLALLSDRLSPEVQRAAFESVLALQEAARTWDSGVHGHLGHLWTDDAKAAVTRALAAVNRFKEMVKSPASSEIGAPAAEIQSPAADVDVAKANRAQV